MSPSWLAERIEQWPLERLIPYANNARTHSDAQVAQIAASIVEFGFTSPLLAGSDGVLVAGHGRLLAARQLGMGSVPVVVLDHLTPTQRRALVIADNKLALNAGWDDAILAQEMADLCAMDYDPTMTGFCQGEVDELLALLDSTSDGVTDPNATPPVQDVAVSTPGDVWLLGHHRLMCGDSTAPSHVKSLLRGSSPHLMVTDPPYGVEYDGGWRKKLSRKKGSVHDIAVGKVLNDDRADWRDAWALFPGDVAYVWHASTFTDVVLDSLRACMFEHRALIVWAKNMLVIGRGNYHTQHELCWYVVRKGMPARWSGGRKQKTLWRFIADHIRSDELVFVRKETAELIYALSGDESTVWEIPKPQKSETGHSTQKPVECMARPIRNNSRPGDCVYDPFVGSGTTIIAAEQTGRRCYAMELSPQYVDVCIRRWQQFTGRFATLESTGRQFPV